MNEYKLATTVDIEVPFHDVDAMQVVWHGYYVKYLEIARCALLRLFDYDYPEMKASGYMWPVVECHLKYVRPALYGQTLRVEASLIEYENRLKVGYKIYDKETGVKMTEAYTIQVALSAETRELQYVSPSILLTNLEKVCVG